MMLGAASLAGRADALPMFKGTPQPFSRDWLEGEAERLSKQAYTPMPEVPQEWRDLSYDEYRNIWFNSHKGLWTDTARPFHVDFFHPGLYFPRPVEVNIVDGDVAQTLAFDISLFDKTDQFPDLPIDETMGYSGLRLRAELQEPEIFEEFLVFQGASYFRGIGTGQNYGLSARGLALNTGDAEGEEFPDFTRFWLEAPEAGARTMIVHALLDGPSVTGAYTFTITPGLPAVVDFEAVLFPRRDLDHVGLAPLTSMFLFDETNRNRFDDFRPAVHDSEGLMIWNGAGEVLWRPLANPATLQVSSFVDDGPRGFGLMQRNRNPNDFADLEAHYENRPSLWITPGEDWGRGNVRLVEIPADREIYDNIVAYWRPREPLPAGRAHRMTYSMAWGTEPPRPRPVARVLNTRMGKGFDQIKNVVTIDFEDHPAFAGEDLDSITKFIGASRGQLTEGVLQRNPGTGGVRLAFSIDPGDAQAVELRAQLVKDEQSLTEVWLYRWTA
ncbi:glucans biosynthesis protein G [Litoreibacter roseus]|uniref:Glucans biosynthesis protein G n=2 Tax=Litoreibacter roseus TaxID=2601869 RepID=A0A6N6JC79_9RHOB|nr:glucans biosynthesis protein G [Litoreibacter roseus]